MLFLTLAEVECRTLIKTLGKLKLEKLIVALAHTLTEVEPHTLAEGEVKTLVNTCATHGAMRTLSDTWGDAHALGDTWVMRTHWVTHGAMRRN